MLNDEVYVEAKAKLRERRDKIHARLHEIRDSRQRRDAPLDKDMEEQAIELENDEVLNQLEPATRGELRDIMAALERIEEETYGTCVDCGGEIGAKRLKAIPEARRCIECAEQAEM